MHSDRNELLRILVVGGFILLGLGVAAWIGSMLAHGEMTFTKPAHGAELAAPPADSRTIVHTKDGRVLAGMIDAATDAERLAVRSREGSITLVRYVAWDDIVSVTSPMFESAPVTGTAFRETLARHDGWMVRDTAPRSASITVRRHLPDETGVTASFVSASRSTNREIAKSHLPRVESIEATADLGRYDPQTDQDELAVVLYAYDAENRPCAAEGTLTAELTVYRADRGSLRSRQRETLRWTVPLASDDFRFGRATVHLPFPSHFEPREHGTYGRLSLSLTVPGSGVYRTVVTGVRIQRFDPVADYDELRRF
ncbi:hypothetical protein JCM19992_32540 [Thermostilla marina]